MKRPALPLMLLILASIFLLFLLNLLLGSVHIPFGKIWELLWGTGAASNPDTMSNQEVIWSNIRIVLSILSIMHTIMTVL